MTLVQRFKAYLDPIEMFFGLMPMMTGYAAFVSWASLIVRGVRGEEAKEDWRVFVSTGAFIAARSLVSGTHVRETVALRSAAVEMRELARDAAEEAERRDQRAGEDQDRLTRLTKRLVTLAALTLAAAIVTLVVSIVGV